MLKTTSCTQCPFSGSTFLSLVLEASSELPAWRQPLPECSALPAQFALLTPIALELRLGGARIRPRLHFFWREGTPAWSLSSLCHRPRCSLGWHSQHLRASFPLERFPSSNILSSPRCGLGKRTHRGLGEEKRPKQAPTACLLPRGSQCLRPGLWPPGAPDIPRSPQLRAWQSRCRVVV